MGDEIGAAKRLALVSKLWQVPKKVILTSQFPNKLHVPNRKTFIQ